MKYHLITFLRLLVIFLAIVGTFWLVNPPRQPPIVSTIDGR